MILVTGFAVAWAEFACSVGIGVHPVVTHLTDSLIMRAIFAATPAHLALITYESVSFITVMADAILVAVVTVCWTQSARVTFNGEALGTIIAN